MRKHVLALLNRHSMVFGNYRWTEFDEEFLQKNVESVVLVDLGETVACLFNLSNLHLIIVFVLFDFNLFFLSFSLSLSIWRAACSLFTSSP